MTWLLVLYVYGAHPWVMTIQTYTELEKDQCFAAQWKDDVSEGRCMPMRKISGSEYREAPDVQPH